MEKQTVSTFPLRGLNLASLRPTPRHVRPPSLPVSNSSPPVKVTSVLDPYVYSESDTFSVGYPSTLISFRTSGLTYEEASKENGTVRALGIAKAPIDPDYSKAYFGERKR